MVICPKIIIYIYSFFRIEALVEKPTLSPSINPLRKWHQAIISNHFKSLMSYWDISGRMPGFTPQEDESLYIFKSELCSTSIGMCSQWCSLVQYLQSLFVILQVQLQPLECSPCNALWQGALMPALVKCCLISQAQTVWSHHWNRVLGFTFVLPRTKWSWSTSNRAPERKKTQETLDAGIWSKNNSLRNTAGHVASKGKVWLMFWVLLS